MLKFKFGLETVLDVKELREKQAIVDYAEISKYFESQDQMLNEMKSISEEAAKTLSGEVSEGIRVFDIKSHFTYLNKIEKQIKVQAVVVEEAKVEKNKLRNALVKLRNEVETLGDLKQRQYVNFRREIYKQEDKITDEFVTYKYGISQGKSFKEKNSKEI